MGAATPSIIKQIFCVSMLRSNTDEITTWSCWPIYSVHPTSVSPSRSKLLMAPSHAYSNNQPGKGTAGQTPPKQQFPSQQYLPKGLLVIRTPMLKHLFNLIVNHEIPLHLNFPKTEEMIIIFRRKRKNSNARAYSGGGYQVPLLLLGSSGIDMVPYPIAVSLCTFLTNLT